MENYHATKLVPHLLRVMRVLEVVAVVPVDRVAKNVVPLEGLDVAKGVVLMTGRGENVVPEGLVMTEGPLLRIMVSRRNSGTCCRRSCGMIFR